VRREKRVVGEEGGGMGIGGRGVESGGGCEGWGEVGGEVDSEVREGVRDEGEENIEGEESVGR